MAQESSISVNFFVPEIIIENFKSERFYVIKLGNYPTDLQLFFSSVSSIEKLEAELAKAKEHLSE